MSVTRQGNWLGQQRIDVPHLRAVESSIAADFDLLAGRMIAGQQALILSGFQIVMSPSPVGGPATSALVNTANGVLLHPLATDSGSIFQSPVGRTTEVLSSTNSRVSGSFVANATNYVGIDLRRSVDSSTVDTVMFLDPTALQETPKIVPLARTLDYVIVISTTDFSSTPGICPIAKVVTNSNNNITSVVDCRRMMFRLGSGGSNPNTQNIYSFPTGRAENTSGDLFYGGDKGIGDLKSWMDAVMTRIQESNGGQYWYSPVSSTNIKLQRYGSPLSNGEYFSWNSGTNTLTWQGLTFLIPNSPAQYNDIANGSQVMNEGDCIYVDLDFTTNHSRSGGSPNPLQMAYGQFQTLGSSTIPGARQIVAWRLNSVIYTRDGNWPVGQLFQAATTSALGLVEILTAANSASAPVVPSVDTTNNNVVAGGLSRSGAGGSLGFGTLTIGGGTNDGAVSISKSSVTTTINGPTVLTSNGTVGGYAARLVPANATNGYVPLAVHLDSQGNIRHVIDHNGYPMGRRSEIREEWWTGEVTINVGASPPYNIGSGTNATGFAGGGKFQVNGTAGVGSYGSSTFTPTTLDTSLGSRMMSLTTGTASGNKIYLQSINSVVAKGATRSIVAEWELQMSAVGANNVTVMTGFFENSTPVWATMSSAQNAIWFKKTSANTNWQAQCIGSNVATTVDTGVAPQANTWQRFRIEIHGSGTSIGIANASTNTALFFINDTLVVSTLTNLPADGWGAPIGFGIENTGALGGAFSMSVGPLLITWNRYSSLPAL